MFEYNTDELRADAYETEMREIQMRTDDDYFGDHVDTLMYDAAFIEYKYLLQALCEEYGRDFDGWWEYSLDSM